MVSLTITFKKTVGNFYMIKAGFDLHNNSRLILISAYFRSKRNHLNTNMT